MNIIKKIIQPLSGNYADHPEGVELSSEAKILQNKVYKHHHHLAKGTDYPLAATDALHSLNAFQKIGYISDLEQSALKEIYHKNLLPFDFVSNRSLNWPEETKERVKIKE